VPPTSTGAWLPPGRNRAIEDKMSEEEARMLRHSLVELVARHFVQPDSVIEISEMLFRYIVNGAPSPETEAPANG
jgi:hypothetical protein